MDIVENDVLDLVEGEGGTVLGMNDEELRMNPSDHSNDEVN